MFMYVHSVSIKNDGRESDKKVLQTKPMERES